MEEDKDAFNPEISEKYYTVRQAAMVLDCSIQTVYKRIYCGILPSRKIWGRVFVLKERVDKMAADETLVRNERYSEIRGRQELPREVGS